MNRPLLTVAVAAFLAVLARGDSSPRFLPIEQATCLHRDRPLIEDVLHNGLSLALQDSPLNRAETCSITAIRLTDEIVKAAREGQVDHVAELAAHLKTVLQKGLAGNLRTARADIPAGSTEEPRLRTVCQRADQVLSLLEDQLRHVDAGDEGPRLGLALRPAWEGCGYLDRALKDIR